MRRPEMPLAPEEFARILGVSRETLERLEVYARLLTKWQKAINLVSAATLADVWRRHFLDSGQIFRHLPQDRCSLLDIGSGAGFPGLVLAILGAEGVHLCESDRRKCVFLREVARETATEIVVHDCRIEDLPAMKADVVTARALASIDVLLDYAHPYLKNDSICLFLKGRAVQAELTTARKKWKLAETLIPSVSDREGVLVRLEGISHVEHGQD